MGVMFRWSILVGYINFCSKHTVSVKAQVCKYTSAFKNGIPESATYTYHGTGCEQMQWFYVSTVQWERHCGAMKTTAETG